MLKFTADKKSLVETTRNFSKPYLANKKYFLLEIIRILIFLPYSKERTRKLNWNIQNSG